MRTCQRLYSAAKRRQYSGEAAPACSRERQLSSEAASACSRERQLMEKEMEPKSAAKRRQQQWKHSTGRARSTKLKMKVEQDN
ncbi:MAG: hypothetical protein KDA51_06740 [Planctomycetales bacterium]|nr:hypothetical protein [Planctomycetales bacterium]